MRVECLLKKRADGHPLHGRGGHNSKSGLVVVEVAAGVYYNIVVWGVATLVSLRWASWVSNFTHHHKAEMRYWLFILSCVMNRSEWQMGGKRGAGVLYSMEPFHWPRARCRMPEQPCIRQLQVLWSVESADRHVHQHAHAQMPALRVQALCGAVHAAPQTF